MSGLSMIYCMYKTFQWIKPTQAFFYPITFFYYKSVDIVSKILLILIICVLICICSLFSLFMSFLVLFFALSAWLFLLFLSIFKQTDYWLSLGKVSCIGYPFLSLGQKFFPIWVRNGIEKVILANSNPLISALAAPASTLLFNLGVSQWFIIIFILRVLASLILVIVTLLILRYFSWSGHHLTILCLIWSSLMKSFD